jgi:two-component system response regulator HydG
MKKILLSWIAWNNDFISNQVNEEGPTFQFHKFFYSNYDKHVILTNENIDAENSKTLVLRSELVKAFKNRRIEIRTVILLKSEIVDLNIIHSNLVTLLYEYTDYEIDIFISPGTPTMQVAWYLIHFESRFKTRLFQTVKPSEIESNVPELIEVKLTQSPTTDYFLFMESASQFNEEFSKNYLITNSLLPIYSLAHKIALSPRTTVLISGETGTGKENLAREIHKKSSRRNFPFITVNCASISSDLLESRMFGYEKGAFTNALKSTDGYFQAANKGTIFLDEIGDISHTMQVALLRFLQEGEIQRVGSNIQEKVDVRVITATNKDLYTKCQNGEFRWDLFYRICVVELTLPPLRDRGKSEIMAFIEYFIEKFYDLFEKNRSKIKFESKCLDFLLNYYWPGNIRELQNLIERCYALGMTDVKLTNLPNQFYIFNKTNSRKLKDVIKKHINEVVDSVNGNLVNAKEILEVGSVNTIRKYLNLTDAEEEIS